MFALRKKNGCFENNVYVKFSTGFICIINWLTWSKKTKYGWNTLTFKGDWWQMFLRARTISFSPLVSLMLTACIRSRDAMIRVPSSLNFTSRENGFGLYSHSCKKQETHVSWRSYHRNKRWRVYGRVCSKLEMYANFQIYCVPLNIFSISM